MPSEAQVLNQIARGVNYLHKNGFSHGNLNPQTILISQSRPVRIKVSEFGLCCKYFERDVIDTKPDLLLSSELFVSNKVTGSFEQNTDEKKESNFSNDKSEHQLSHPKYWTRAKYESLPVDQEGKRSIPRATVNGDIFAAGCLFFYYLTGGFHPFGNTNSIVANISKMEPVNLKSNHT